MLPLGTPAPDWKLPAPATGQFHDLDGSMGEKGLLVAFICNHCPYVVHVMPELDRLFDGLPAEGVGVVAVNANDVEKYPQDGPDKMAELVAARGWKIPFLLDETQQVAKAYHAACTPDFYLFDRNRELVYRGQLDGSRPGNDVPVTGEDLREAIRRLLEGREGLSFQRPSLGCNIKWKPGNEPDYFGS